MTFVVVNYASEMEIIRSLKLGGFILVLYFFHRNLNAVTILQDHEVYSHRIAHNAIETIAGRLDEQKDDTWLARAPHCFLDEHWAIQKARTLWTLSFNVKSSTKQSHEEDIRRLCKPQHGREKPPRNAGKESVLHSLMVNMQTQLNSSQRHIPRAHVLLVMMVKVQWFLLHIMCSLTMQWIPFSHKVHDPRFSSSLAHHGVFPTK